MVAALLHDWFGWPLGAVLTNLIASALWVVFGAWRLCKRFQRLERKHDETQAHLARLHEKTDRIHEHLGIG